MKYYKILCVALFISVASFAQKSVLIRYQPKIGSTLKNEMSAIMEMNIKVGEQNMQTKVNMGIEMLYKTKERKKKINEIDVIINKITSDMKNPMMNGSYNSDNKDETDPYALKMTEIFEGVLEQPLTMSINTKGEFTEILNIAKFFPKISASKALELEEQISNKFIQFPEKKVKVGDQWTMSIQMKQIGDFEYTYTLTGIERKRLLLSVTGNMIEEETDSVKILESVIAGNIILDRKTGEILVSNIVMDMKMQMITQGNTMVMSLKADISLKATQL
ncbi:DUF6263 family protein [Flavicella sp.]|uniref:DUF6263 family protein n=1 Tax=Flavicella sp. TaxID=2957742 RepID=UPI003019622E